MDTQVPEGLSAMAQALYERVCEKKVRQLRNRVTAVDSFLRQMLSELQDMLNKDGTFRGTLETSYEYEQDDITVVSISVVSRCDEGIDLAPGEFGKLVHDAFREFNGRHLDMPVKRKRIEISYDLRAEDGVSYCMATGLTV